MHGRARHLRFAAGLLALGLVSQLSGGCASTATSRKPVPADETTATGPERVPLIPEAYHYFTTGNYLSGAGDDSAAVVHYRRALTYDPGSRQIRMALAQSYARLGRFDEAAITAESIRPRDADVLQFLADVYVRLRNFERRRAVFEEWAEIDSTNAQVWQFLANAYRVSGDTLQQIHALERLARLQPDPSIYEQLGLLRLGTGSLNDAEDWFHTALAADSGQRSTRVLLGVAQVWSERDNLDSALSYYRRAVALNYYNTELRKRFFYFQLQRGLLEDAIAEAYVILRLSPVEPDVSYRLALLEYDTGRTDSAEVRLTRFITQSGDDALARYLLGRIALERGDTLTAEAQYVQSISMTDSLVEAYLSLGLLYNRREWYDSAVALYRYALRIHPDQSGLLFGLGAALEQGGQYEEAVATFEHLIVLEPDFAPALNYLGYMWADRGERLGEALELIKRAVELQPENGAYLDSYAWVLFRLGRTRAAAEKLREALNYVQDDAVVYEHYGDILADLGQLDEAQANWQRALDLDPDNEALREKLKR